MTLIKVSMATNWSRYPDALVNSFDGLPDLEILSTGRWSKDVIAGAQSVIDQKPDILHFHWPEAHIHSEDLGNELVKDYQNFFKLVKEAGIKIVWTQHNILPHNHRESTFYKKIYQLFATNTDGLIHHSHWGKTFFHETYQSNAKDAVIRHGTFSEEATYAGSKEEARKELDIPNDKRVFFTLGGVRRDKNLEDLLNCFKMRDDKNELLIFSLSHVGPKDYIEEIKVLANTVKNIRIIEGEMPSEDLALNARASDAFIFAYGDKNLTSGSPHLSHAHGIPQVILPSPYSEEVMGETGLFFEPTPSIAEGLNRYLNELDQSKLETCQTFFNDTPKEFQWKIIGKQTLDFYKELLVN